MVTTHASALEAIDRDIAVLARTALRPPPRLTVSEWADEFRELPRESSAEPGRWRTDRAPYQRGILDAISDPTVESVRLMCASQVGKTEILLNALGYFVHQDPAPVLVVLPTIGEAQQWSKTRLAPMVRRELAGRVRRLHLVRFPGYAPELNPDEGVCKLAKGMLANGCPGDSAELLASVSTALKVIRRHPKNLRACIRHTGLLFFAPYCCILYTALFRTRRAMQKMSWFLHFSRRQGNEPNAERTGSPEHIPPGRRTASAHTGLPRWRVHT